jgi:hypothetical protein
LKFLASITVDGRQGALRKRSAETTCLRFDTTKRNTGDDEAVFRNLSTN